MGRLGERGVQGDPMSDYGLVCTHPFEWFELHPDGSVFLCCPAWLKTPVGNLLTAPWEELWNGAVAQRLRRAVLDGSFRHCNRRRCPRLAGRKAPVRPLADLPAGPVAAALRSGTTRLPYGPQILNLCHDRSCNLACPSCRPAPWQAVGEERERAARLSELLLAGPAAHAEELRVSGYGDPFAAPAYGQLLASIAPGSWPRLRRVHLHTNGQLWDAAAWEALPGLHGLVHSAEISIDAASAATYAQNRRGGDFARLRRNLAYLATLPPAVELSFVTQANNVGEMVDFADWAAGYGWSAYFSQLVNWGTFSKEEFRRRAVHLPEHPQHQQLLAQLRLLHERPEVDLGNLAPLLTAKAS
jgi:hypothetical protein